MGIGFIGDLLVILNILIVVYIGIVYIYLFFMILLIYVIFEWLDESFIEVVEDFGCLCILVFWLVIVFLLKNGVIVGCFFVFIFVIGEFVIFVFLGGFKILMIGKVLWEEFFLNCDWFVVFVVVIIFLLVLIILIVLF